MRPIHAPLLVVLLLASARAQEAPPSEVSGARALETLKVLASDAFRGRKSGLESGRAAERHLADRLAELGLPGGVDGDYFHVFTANTTEEGTSARLALRTGDGEPGEAEYLSDFVTLLYSGRGDLVDRPVVFVGYGIVDEEHGRDDYAGVDVTDKVVLAIRGKPDGSPYDEQAQIGWKSSAAAGRGAAGFLLVQGDRPRPGTIQEKFYRETLPAVWIGSRLADRLLQAAGRGDLAAETAAHDAGEGAGFELENVRATLRVDARLLPDAEMRNVVALWRCREGARRPGEYVVVGAHLDHVGVDGAGNVYNGADDNASGSATLLEVARAVAATGERFDRNVLFVWFAGEEQGLLGSRAFVNDPPVPLGSIAAMLNADMVGQGKPVLAVGGAEVYPRDADRLSVHELPGQEIVPFRASPNSDHWPFQAAGIPAFFLITRGPHPNYHMPDDDWGNIDPDLLERAGRYLRAVLARAADTDWPLCRPARRGEWLWHRAPVFDLHAEGPPAPGAGIDLRVVWLEGDAATVMNGIDHHLRLREEEKIPEQVYVPDAGAPLDRQLDDLRPTVLLGVRGRAALSVPRPAARLGVVAFAPWLGSDPAPAGADLAALDALCAETGALLVLHGAPEAVDPAGLAAPLLLTPAQAERSAPDGRWLATVRADVGAEEIARLASALGPTRVLVTPAAAGDPEQHARVVQAMLDAGLPEAKLTPLFGGNLLRLLRARPTPPRPPAKPGD